jgi:hypothetical protein
MITNTKNLINKFLCLKASNKLNALLENNPNGYISTKEVAQLIRIVLKDKYPLHKFSVRCDGHNAIFIKWEDGPKTIDNEIAVFQSYDWDPYTDYHTLNTKLFLTDDQQEVEVWFSAQYIFFNRSMSLEVENKIQNIIALKSGKDYNPETNYNLLYIKDTNKIVQAKYDTEKGYKLLDNLFNNTDLYSASKERFLN